MSGTDLRATQELFWTLITHPTGVREAIDGLARRDGTGAEEVDRVFAGDARLPAAERLDIYANMYFFRLLDCLAEDFPRTLAAVGGNRFHNLVTDYLLRHPSAHPSLRELGRRLPDFIAAHPLGAEFPYLADLARLEWARADLFDAPDATPLSRTDLARLPQERAGEARFTLVPAFTLLRLRHDVVRLWRDLKDPQQDEPADRAAGTQGNAAAEEHADQARPARGPRAAPAKPVTVRVWRQGFVVYHAGLEAEEARALELIAAGEPLARICQQVAAGRSITRATERVGRLLQAFLDDGILAGCDLIT
jgi:Putative DNA-binding domain